ncbi:hypothetical protein STEG23_017582 [Scotinomys teguina]
MITKHAPPPKHLCPFNQENNCKNTGNIISFPDAIGLEGPRSTQTPLDQEDPGVTKRYWTKRTQKYPRHHWTRRSQKHP